jgi:hypothetical protein
MKKKREVMVIGMIPSKEINCAHLEAEVGLPEKGGQESSLC